MIQLKCAACGFVSDVDMKDKLTTFIFKNPPEVKRSSKDKKAMRRAEKKHLKEGEAANEEQKKLMKKEARKHKKSSKEGPTKSTKKKTQGSDEEHSPNGSQAGNNEPVSVIQEEDDDDDDEVQWQTDTSFKAAHKRIQEQLSAVTADMVMLSTEEKENSTQKKSLPREVKEPNGTLASHAHEILVSDIKEYLKKGPTASHLKSHLGSCLGTHQEVVDSLFEALFEGVEKGFAKEDSNLGCPPGSILDEPASHDPVVSQSILLHGIEVFSGKASQYAVKEVAVALKYLYDADVLEEETIVEWYEKQSTGGNKGSPIWKHVNPFVEWLQSAESESDEEE